MSESSLHRDILRDIIADTLQSPTVGNWAAGVQRQYASLGLASPLSGSSFQNIDAHGFQQAMLARDKSVWEGLHIFLRNAPSACVELCTYLRRFRGLSSCLESLTMSCPCQSRSSGLSSISGWAALLCQLNRAGL